MSACNCPDAAICLCGPVAHPAPITNPPGLTTIRYRPGDYSSFRSALLLPLPGETQLTQQTLGNQVTQIWRPGAQGDLAVQLIEWWAYLSEILTFYNERIANQAYLGTADLPESVNRLVDLLGYRPRPGIGATGLLAALTTGSNPVTLPAGFQVQSKPGPGQPPQIFESSTDVTFDPPPVPLAPGASFGAVSLVAPSQPSLIASGSALLKGTPGTIAVGDELLLLGAGITLSLMPSVSDVSVVPRTGKNLIIIANINGLLLFRLFDSMGNLVFQADETNFPDESVQITALKSQLNLLWPPHSLTSSEKNLLITELSSIFASPLSNQWSGTDSNYALLRVTSVTPETDPSATTNTRILYSFTFRGGEFPTTANPADYRLLKSSQSSHLYQYLSPPSIPAGATTFDLESITRQISVGDPLLIKDPRPIRLNKPMLLSITSYSEVIYYANNPSSPSIPPAQFSGSASGASLEPAIPILHSQLTFTPALTSAWDVTVAQILLGWNEVGTLIDTPSPAFNVPDASATTPLTLSWSNPASALPTGLGVLIQDANGNGGTGTTNALGVQLDSLGQTLASPTRALFNLFKVSRGKTVSNEILGSGNSLIAGQDFVLQNSPVTYLQDPKSVSGGNYSSTVRVWVNQLEWTEVPSFYNQPPGARIFVTREDEQGKTNVICGDGRNGSRLPTGVNNVVASYRYGSGAAVPGAGSLTVVSQLQPGLRSLLNPVPVGGGADPDPPARVRQLAPRSLLTLDRAVSIDDFEAIALQAPGVTRAMARLTFDPQTQRAGVTVWVGDDAAAVTAARAAFAAAADPNRQPQLLAATKFSVSLSLNVVYDPHYLPQMVQAAVQTALADPESGLLGRNVVTIGQVIFESQIYAACIAVPGVVSVHSLRWSPTNDGQRHDPGAGNYFALADDGRQPMIVMELAS